MRNLADTIVAVRKHIQTLNGRAILKTMAETGLDIGPASARTPQIDEMNALKAAVRRYQRFYGYTSKYLGNREHIIREHMPMQIPDAIEVRETRQIRRAKARAALKSA